MNLSTYQLTADSKAMEFAESLCLNFKDVPGVSSSFYYFLGNVFKPRRQAAQDSDLGDTEQMDFMLSSPSTACSLISFILLWKLVDSSLSLGVAQVFTLPACPEGVWPSINRYPSNGEIVAAYPQFVFFV